ncbi:hypothetical protein [Paenibacillus sp. Soil724D2]|uniref:hypothetical protein n=1 Tax=Paenibacillus sp. (strain Soil724D2) TaxID=1736392 RepID=UPI00138F8DCD|nr:hypothetical protein [Paenibacillus sp. Soil724D2]
MQRKQWKERFRWAQAEEVVEKANISICSFHLGSSASLSLLFFWVFNSQAGLFNYGVSFFGIEPIHWLLDQKFAMWALSQSPSRITQSIRWIVLL